MAAIRARRRRAKEAAWLKEVEERRKKEEAAAEKERARRQKEAEEAAQTGKERQTPILKFDFEPLSDAADDEEEEKFERLKRSEDISMEDVEKESSGKRKISESNMSIMDADILNKMKKLFQQMGAGDDDSASESSSDAGSLSEESSAGSGLEDMFKVEVLPRTARDWLTEQDAEQDCISRLAEYLRDQPLLPADPDDPEGLRSFDDVEKLDKGVHLPFAHCAFKKCQWRVTCGGVPPIYKSGDWSYEAPEKNTYASEGISQGGISVQSQGAISDTSGYTRLLRRGNKSQMP